MRIVAQSTLMDFSMRIRIKCVNNPFMITSEDVDALVRRYKTQLKLAEKIGVTQATVSRWLKGATPEARYQEKLYALMLGDGLSPSDASVIPAPVFTSGRTLPVYCAAEGGPGEIVITTEPIEMVLRPWYLGEVKDAYAVVIVGESMVPKFHPGDMVVINPKEPILRDRYYLFIQENETGEFIATVKRLISATATEWKVEQYNPPKTFNLPKNIWTRAVRIVGSYDRG
jgi:transcriptional regulator with XRE-family HTH domain